jgi:hypothetical protein
VECRVENPSCAVDGPNLSCCELFDERYFASSNDLQYLGREEAIVIELPRIGPLNTIPFLRGRLDKAQLAEVCQDEAICMAGSDELDS